ncbi:MAG TPA: hypothetical protein VMX54_12145 [Vicinamibacteria bacterium]|nr:hypothetical protein [Vicinamibacteria bacterium]
MRLDLLLLILATALSYPLGLWLRQPWLLPVLNALPAYAVLVHRLRRGERGGAVRGMLVWAITLALTATILFVWWPDPVGAVVIHGPDYKDQMFQWIRTAVGAEGNIRLFLPHHLLQLAAFVVVGLLTAGAGAVVMGAVLMNYMAYYVAALARAGVPPWAVTLLGWQPWTIARVLAFCTLGVILAEPLLFRVMPAARGRLKKTGRAAYVVAAMSGILAEWFLKATFAPIWGRWLHRLLP